MVGSFFDTQFFVANRQRLKEVFGGKAPIVLTANGLLQRNADSTYQFRQDSSFWYLSGIDEPDVVMVLDKEKEYLIVPGRDDVRTAFDGRLDILRLAERAGIDTIYEEAAGWKYLKRRLQRVKHVATLAALDPYEKRFGFYANPARARLIERVKACNPSVELLDIRPDMARLRSIKHPEELQAIRRAIQLTNRAFNRLSRRLGTLANEYEAEALLSQYVRKHGASLAYAPIVASDDNACILHYQANSAALGDRLLIDFGAEVENYAADITRTYSVAKPSKRLQAVHEAVMTVHGFALELLKPGVMCKEYEKQVQNFMGEKLRELGLIKTINSDSVRKYYPHATSHFLGLDVHDAADYKAPLQAGMVLTVEPGIYIPEEGIGIRVEDDVLITHKGNRNLSASLPTSLT